MKLGTIQRGFTLIETLTALFVLGVVVALATQVGATLAKTTRRIDAESRLIEEVRTAQEVITSKLLAAWYVYPPGTRLAFNGGATTRNALAGRPDWTVGEDPIVAMVLPPGAPGSSCQRGGDTRGCYQLVAYYAFPRGHYQASVGPGQRLPEDPENADTWVLMEFRANLYGYAPAGPCDPVPVPGGNLSRLSGRLLAEYLQPEEEDPAYTLFEVGDAGSVTLRLRMARSLHGAKVRVPAASRPPLALTITPRNLRACR